MQLPKVELNSDFTESYDHMFDKGETDFRWTRYSIGLSRGMALLELSGMGLRVPYYDRVSTMSALLGKLRPFVVVYTDEYAHRGEEKEPRTLSLDTLQKYGSNNAMLYVGQFPGNKVSYRYLRMGQRKMWMRYSSDDPWRSNCGNVEIAEHSWPSLMQFTDSGFHDPENFPAIAIDFVSSGGKWFAIDFNTSPGIDHTPFTEKYSATEIVDSIKKWFQFNATRLTQSTGCPTSG